MDGLRRSIDRSIDPAIDRWMDQSIVSTHPSINQSVIFS